MPEIHATDPVKPAKQKRFSIVRTITGVIIAAGIFYLGVAVGQGKIVFGHDKVYHQSVNKQLPDNLNYTGVEQVYDSLRSNFDGKLDETTIENGLKEGLAKATQDPYTEFFDQKGAKDFNDQLSGTFTGIGAELSKDTTNNVIVVVSPIAGFPAEKAGMKPKDVIAEIDGKSAYDLTVSEAVSKIRGPKGSSVKIKVIRDKSQELTFDIVRDQITIPSVTSKTLDGNIGYIKISRYAEDTADLAQKAARGFKDAGVKGVVLDVRGDPGGLLDAAVDVSSLWLNNKTVLTERRGGVVVRTYESHNTAVLNGIPTVVLIDEGSASASEITAGALHDNKAATLIGVKSFGKGSVQQLVRFKDDTLLKVTIARWYTPDGKNIDKEGINPDKEVKNNDADVKAGTDAQLNAATDSLK